MATDGMMNRRFVTLSFAALGTALVIPGRAVAQAAPALTWAPKALTPAQAKTLDAVAELIMPATDTPGAREAGVPQFVDQTVGIFCTPADAQTIRAGLDFIEADALAAYGAGFTELRPDQQLALLTRYDADARPAPTADVGRGDTETGLSNRPTTPPPPPSFFPMLKEMITSAYFTSKLGATKAVIWDPFPGAFRGCVPLSEIGRAWEM